MDWDVIAALAGLVILGILFRDPIPHTRHTLLGLPPLKYDIWWWADFFKRRRRREREWPRRLQ